jgi:hypothetical protein
MCVDMWMFEQPSECVVCVCVSVCEFEWMCHMYVDMWMFEQPSECVVCV